MYASQDQQIDMQIKLIALGNHCLEFADWVHPPLRPKYFDMLSLILQRGELSLRSLQLIEESKNNVIPPKIFKRKVDVAADYELFIYQVLSKCIKMLNIKHTDSYKQKFIQSAFAQCYFVIPKFRSTFLSLINKKDLNSS